MLGYHFPAVSAPGIPVEALPTLPISGLKDSSGEPRAPARRARGAPSRAGALYTGSSSILSFAGPAGCTGAILSLANVEPERCAEAFAGDAAAQRALYDGHVAAHDRFPQGLKELVAKRFGTATTCRLLAATTTSPTVTTSTGSVTPLSSRRRSAPSANPPAVASRASRLTTISPAPPDAAMRAATCTPWPV